MQEMWAPWLGQDNPLEEEITTHPGILAWEIPWTEECDGLQSMELQRVWHNWAHTHTHTHQLYIEGIYNKVLLYSTGSSIQYRMINLNGKELQKQMSLYVSLNHFAVQQKLTQHCKSMIFPFLNKNFNKRKSCSFYKTSRKKSVFLLTIFT